MRIVKILALGAAALTGASAANATLTSSLTASSTNYLAINYVGTTQGMPTTLTSGSTVFATISGGTAYTSDQPFADIPKGFLYQNTFLAAGPLAGQPATVTFAAPTSYLGFLWGSPDTYNKLTVYTNLNTTGYAFDPVTLGFTTTNGNQAVSQSVSFTASLGELITGVSFTNNPVQDAFEVGNFSVTPVPEPASWAMMVGGFGLIGAALRRRQQIRLTYA